MKQVLSNMISIYKPNGYDWMGYKINKNNPYTYHHINEKHDNGPETIENGAILSLNAHRLLHKLSRLCPPAYRDFQNLFQEINNECLPIDDNMYSEIYALLLDIFYHNVYNIHKFNQLKKAFEDSFPKEKKVKQKYINYYKHR